MVARGLITGPHLNGGGRRICGSGRKWLESTCQQVTCESPTTGKGQTKARLREVSSGGAVLWLGLQGVLSCPFKPRAGQMVSQVGPAAVGGGPFQHSGFSSCLPKEVGPWCPGSVWQGHQAAGRVSAWWMFFKASFSLGLTGDSTPPLLPLPFSLAVLASACFPPFQNNLNLQRDLAVLIAQQFKSSPAREPVFVLHR